MTSLPPVVMFSDAYDDYTLELANALARSTPSMTLVQPEDTKRFPLDERDPELEVLRIPKARIRDPRGITAGWRIRRALIADPDGIIHVQQTGDPTLNPWFSTIPRSRRLVMTVHDVRPHPGDHSYRKGAQSTQRLLARRVDRFVVHSPGLAEDLSESWQIDADRITVIDHGELGSLYRRRASGEQLVREARRVLFFGRRFAYKGLDLLFEALIDPRFGGTPPVTLVIAGRGDSVEALVGRAPSWLRVELIDHYLSAQDVVDQFDRASVLCLPYREASQSGVAALGMGMGTPMISSNVGGLADMLDSEVACMVEPGRPLELADALQKVFSDPASAAKRAANGLERSQGRLSWQGVAGRHLDLYRELQAAGPGWSSRLSAARRQRRVDASDSRD